MKPSALFSIFLGLFVLWTFEPEYLDVLEYSYDCNQWFSLSGPYHLTDDGADYIVPVDTRLSTNLFFRVRRDFGTPNTNSL